jgi:hypothetical protein
MPSSPQISVSSVANDDDYEDGSSQIGSRITERIIEVRGVGVGVSHPMNEIRKLPGTPMPQSKHNRFRNHRSLPSSGENLFERKRRRKL